MRNQAPTAGSAPRPFLDRHLGTVLTVALLFTGQVASFAILQARVNTLELSVAGSVSRSEHMDANRRIEVLEHELVPRSEHLLRDTELNKRLDEINDSIKDVRARLEVIDSHQRTK